MCKPGVSSLSILTQSRGSCPEDVDFVVYLLLVARILFASAYFDLFHLIWSWFLPKSENYQLLGSNHGRRHPHPGFIILVRFDSVPPLTPIDELPLLCGSDS